MVPDVKSRALWINTGDGGGERSQEWINTFSVRRVSTGDSLRWKCPPAPGKGKAEHR